MLNRCGETAPLCTLERTGGRNSFRQNEPAETGDSGRTSTLARRDNIPGSLEISGQVGLLHGLQELEVALEDLDAFTLSLIKTRLPL